MLSVRLAPVRVNPGLRPALMTAEAGGPKNRPDA